MTLAPLPFPVPMSSLRWTLGIVAALFTAAIIAIAVIGGGFRRSFGAPDNSPLIESIILLAAGLVFASLLWPDRRMLMHTVAVLMAALCIGCAFIARETIFTATMGWSYAAGWFVFYYRSLSAAAAP